VLWGTIIRSVPVTTTKASLVAPTHITVLAVDPDHVRHPKLAHAACIGKLVAPFSCLLTHSMATFGISVAACFEFFQFCTRHSLRLQDNK
jgi:hypothetical protein